MKTMAWPMEPEEIMWALRSIQFKHYKWDIFHRGDTSILPEALVLSAEEHQFLTQTAEAVWAALREVEEVVRGDEAMLEALAVPEQVREAVVEQRDDNPRVTRCDFHLTEQGRWVISEFNDDVPSGFGECTGLAQVLSDDWADRFQGLAFKGDLRKAVVEAMAPWESIGFVHATGYSEDLQHVALVKEWLEEAGHPTVIGSPANFRVDGDQAFVFDTPVDAIFRYYPGEWLGDLPNVEEWCKAAPFLPMMNPLSALASQSKRFYASWNEQDLPLSREARSLFEEYLPASVYLSSLDREEVLKNPKRWVLKGAFGRMGKTVRIGPLMPREKWEKAVQEAFEAPQIVVAQKRFDTAALWTAKGMGYATVGVYLVDGRFAGYFSRIDKGPLIDYDSWHVPTLVEIS
jgi:glutathionylspermidine synthase